MHPVAQAQKDELSHNRVVAVDRVAATGVVAVIRSTVTQHVVDPVFQPLERKRRPKLIALGCVVENHVQNHFDAGSVQRPHHLFELANLAARLGARRIAAVRRKKGKRIVAPVVAPLQRDARRGFRWKLVYGHQFNSSHTQRF